MPMSSIDWAKALERVREAGRNTGNNADPKDIYKLRAKRLAELPERPGFNPAASSASLDADRLEVLVFRPDTGSPVRYAVPAPVVAEVIHHVRISPVPGAPSDVRGVIQVRGEIWPLFAIPDLRPDRETPAAGSDTSVILMRARGNRQLGILASGLDETRVVSRSSLRPGQADHVLGILPDLTVVLQVESIGAPAGAHAEK